MIWGVLLLIIAGIFATGTSFYLHQETLRLKFLGLFWASGIFVAIEGAVLLSMVGSGPIIEFITWQMIEWGQIYCLSLILSSLLLFVRESKPEFSQFPISYCILPFLIIVSYLLVYHTIVLKDWLINIYQGGAVLVSLLMYGIYSYRDGIYKTVAAGAVLFFVTFMIYLILPGYILLWQLLLAISIATVSAGYLIVDKHYADD